MSPAWSGLPRHWRALLLGAAGAAIVLAGYLKTHTFPDVWRIVWLVPLAHYDSRHRAVPHILFIAVPWLVACSFAVARGDGTMALLSLLFVAASERHFLDRRWRCFALCAVVACAAVIVVFSPPESMAAMLALIGFWLAYELGWWAGVDALTAMTLVLLYPDSRLLAALAISHLGLAFISRRHSLPFRPRRLTVEELHALGVPGLPALTLGAVLYVVWQWWLP